jgi:hypothetical protein
MAKAKFNVTASADGFITVKLKEVRGVDVRDPWTRQDQRLIAFIMLVSELARNFNEPEVKDAQAEDGGLHRVDAEA